MTVTSNWDEFISNLLVYYYNNGPGNIAVEAKHLYLENAGAHDNYRCKFVDLPDAISFIKSKESEYPWASVVYNSSTGFLEVLLYKLRSD
jgi:hypothetical protein